MNNKRTLYLILATVAMLMTGMMYNFTVFNTPICNDLGCSQSTVSLVFSAAQITFCLGGLFLGFVFKKLSLRLLLMSASLCMSAGLFLSSFITNVNWLFLTYAFLMNFSAGFLYKAILSAIIPWFEDKPGLATGIMMMATGLTAFLFNVPTTQFMQKTSWREAMRLLSLVVCVCTMSAALVLKRKESDGPKAPRLSGKAEDKTTKQMLSTPSFYLYFAWTVLLLAGCTTVTGNAVGLAGSIGVSATKAAALSMFLSCSNACSRIWYGSLYDRRGRRLSMGIATTFFFFGAIFVQLAILGKMPALLVVAFVCIGFAFGGVPTISSTYTLRTFGRTYYASNFGIMGFYSLFSPILGTTVFSLLYKRTGSYQASYLYIFLYAILAIVLYVSLNKVLKGRE